MRTISICTSHEQKLFGAFDNVNSVKEPWGQNLRTHEMEHLSDLCNDLQKLKFICPSTLWFSFLYQTILPQLLLLPRCSQIQTSIKQKNIYVYILMWVQYFLCMPCVYVVCVWELIDVDEGSWLLNSSYISRLFWEINKMYAFHWNVNSKYRKWDIWRYISEVIYYFLCFCRM